MRYARLTIIITLILLLIPLISAAEVDTDDGAPLVISNNKAIEIAFNNNGLIEAATRMVESGIAEGKSLYADFLPQLSTDYSYTRLDKAPTTTFDFGDGPESIPVGTADNYEWAFQLVFPIYAGGARSAARKMMGINEDQKLNAVELAKRGVSYGVTQAYFGYLSTDYLIDVRKSSLDYLESAHDSAQKWFDEGYFLHSDVLQIAVAMGKAEIEYNRALDMKESAELSLKQVLGIENSRQIDLVEIISPPEIKNINLNELLKLAESEHPEIRDFDLQIKMLEQQLKTVASQKKPLLNFVSRYSHTGDDPLLDGSSLGGDPNTLSATLQLSWSIYDSGKVENGKKQLKKTIEALKLQRKDTYEKMKISVESSLKDYLRSLKNVEVTSGNLEAAKEHFRILSSRYDEGLERTTDVLESEALLSGAKLEYKQSIYDTHLSLAKLAFDAGFKSSNEFINAILKTQNQESSMKGEITR